jgi:hypothetical protein
VVYGPCRQPARDQFVQWLLNLQIEDDELWMLMGDFNFYRYAETEIKPGVIFKTLLPSTILLVTWALLNCL